MKKLNYSIKINAPAEKVWDTMLRDDTYREWTKAFSPDSHYKGDWSEGSKMTFLGSDPETGEEGGMVSRIAKNIPYEILSIEHLGIIVNGKEDTISEEAKKWSPATESYILNEIDGATELRIEVKGDEKYGEMFNEMWPKALKRLKELAENKE